MSRDTLGRFAFPVVRIACRYCNRRGHYKLETLIGRFGREALPGAVLAALSADCNWHGNRSNKRGCHGPYLMDTLTKRDRDLIRRTKRIEAGEEAE